MTFSTLLPLLSPVHLVLIVLLFCPSVRAEVAPVELRVPQEKAWVGQRVPFFVDLRAPGSFAGTAHFDLPQLPGSMVIKIGAPVVGTQDIAGETWFLQTHEFALFSQRPGPLDLPAFAVRFARREGFTGPATDVQAQSPGFSIEIQRPPGSEQIGFLITTESLDVTETWEPAPGPAQVGAIFKRTIIQRAPQQSGISLVPAPTTAPDGIRVYPGEAETKDDLYRGQFLGERKETVTYLLQVAGTLTLPALTYVWWNPTTAELESKTLPSVTFDVVPAPAAPGATITGATERTWPWLLAMAAVAGSVAWQRQRVAAWGRRTRRALNPPHRAAARQLRHACRRHDAAAAIRAWAAWRGTQNAGLTPDPELRAAVLELQRHLFGPPASDPWQGDDLARDFDYFLTAAKVRSLHQRASVLPLLNS